jgi:hypothetical protein
MTDLKCDYQGEASDFAFTPLRNVSIIICKCPQCGHEFALDEEEER